MPPVQNTDIPRENQFDPSVGLPNALRPCDAHVEFPAFHTNPQSRQEQSEAAHEGAQNRDTNRDDGTEQSRIRPLWIREAPSYLVGAPQSGTFLRGAIVTGRMLRALKVGK